ncbi:SNF-related serine/threonine-protein kinase-like [Etheostoma cragini]|uniref:SNF-related serine/threonine-protein kinase-like n=1 Tax=Etheostoma cragini TaxID=417921 RepID=UPI00155EA0A7|nr:SNF-related serine/threonine-protein kinase-like [Etheostoma cragini]
MHQDIEDSLAASSMSHAGGPQSPARSAENLLNGHRSKGLMELGRREDATLRDSAQGATAAVSGPASGSGTARAPAASTSAATKQRSCLFRPTDRPPTPTHTNSVSALSYTYNVGPAGGSHPNTSGSKLNTRSVPNRGI